MTAPKNLFTACILFYSSLLFGTNFYVSPSGNDNDSGLSPGTSWQSISRVQSAMGGFSAGDSILFERGGVFRGSLSIQCYGSPGSPVVFGAYGVGELPVISGSRTVNGWSQHNANIWKASTTGILEHVYFNDELMQLARFPNSGWLRNDQGSTTTLFDDDLTQAVGYWTDATLVVRGTMWSYDLATVSQFENSELQFNSIYYDLSDNDWGYFLRDKFEELDMAGEWWWDRLAEELYFWPPNGADPNAVNIETSIHANGFTVEWQRQWIEIRDLNFKHQKEYGVRIDGASFVNVNSCVFEDLYMGVNSYGNDNSYVDNTFRNTYATAIHIIDDNSLISYNEFNDIAMIPGLGESQWGYFGIRTQGSGNEISNNRLETIGYIGIDSKSSTLIERNYLNNTLALLNDGGGIAFDNADGMIIRNNIILNSQGNLESAAPNHYNYGKISHGIYFGNSSIKNTTIEENTVAHCTGSGIHVDHTMVSEGNKILNNVVYNNRKQIQFSDYSNYNGPGATAPFFVPAYDTEIRGNTFCSLEREQPCMTLLQVHTSDYADFGAFDSNFYYNPFNEMCIELIDNHAGNIIYRYTLEKYQQDMLEDPNSFTSPFWMDEYVVTDTLSGNMMSNGDFVDGLDNWEWWPNDGEVFIDPNVLDGNTMKVEFNTDNTYYEIKVSQPNTVQVEDGEMYLYTYSSKGSDHGEFTAIFKPSSWSWSQNPMMLRHMPIDSDRRDQGFVFPATVNESGKIYINQHYTEPDLWLDNVGLYKVQATPVDADQMLVLFYNETEQTSTVQLSGCWSRLNGSMITGSFDLEPFTSVVLRKMDESNCASNSGQLFQLKMMMEGPYNESTGVMDDDLRALEYIPLTEPYTGMGYTHYGDGGDESIASSVLANGGNDAIVDWVFVELRDVSDNSVVLSTRAALLQRDGDVVDIDGVSALNFNTSETEAYIAVKHRVHLGIMASDPVQLGQGVVSLDFSDPLLTLYGQEPGKLTTDNKVALWAGNSSHDNTIKYSGNDNDRDPILSVIGGVLPTAMSFGYLCEDVNMDGVVKYTGPNNDRDKILFNIGGNVPTAVRLEQLP